MRLQLVLVACLFNFGSQTVQPHRQTVKDETIVKDRSKTHGNFQNLFDSIAMSDVRRSGTYRDILTQDVERMREAFDAMKDELWLARNRNGDKQRNFYQKSEVGEYVVAVKRETKKNNRSTDDNRVFVVESREQIVHLFTLAFDTTLVVVYFSHQLCNPCKRISPIYDEFPRKYQNVSFLKVNTKKNPEIADSQKVRTVPTFVFYRAQQELFRLIGTGVTKSVLEEKIQQNY